ncbi:MAG TPA: hypothetical protein VNL14_02355 [Candidatus Acidoferrales bacterium]|nr:hypothetical protein [Candidatus Acidoferrales bacterium]
MAAILYVATDEGVVVLKSEDRRSWKVETQALEDWSVNEVAVLPSAPNRVFAGTRGDGVWLSEDFGTTWKKPSYGKPGPGKVRCVTLDPSDPNTLYAGGEPIDVFVSRDGGKTWTNMSSVWEIPWVRSVTYPVAEVEPHVRDIALDPKDSRTIYAALQVGYMLKSQDGGETWQLLNKDLDADVHTIVVHPQDSRRILIATGGHDCRSGKVRGRALYRSDDGGESWSPMALDFSQEYSVPLTMHPRNPDIVYSALAHGTPGRWRRGGVGADGIVIRTKDGGKSWEKVNGKFTELNNYFAGAIAFDQGNPNFIYAAVTNGELYMSDDGGDTWSEMGTKVRRVSDMKCVEA